MPTINRSALVPNATFKSTDRTDRTLIVQSPSGNELPVGIYRFRLVVTDNANNPSTNDMFAVVTVLDTAAPTALILLREQQVNFGQDFTIDGTPSLDVGGEVVAWEWTLVEMPQ